MNWALSVLLLLGFACLSQSVILSLEESELGADNYRYLYYTVPDVEIDGSYQKPYFTLVNSELARPYGALGSLYCATNNYGIAVYSDVDGDDMKEWNCQPISRLPFSHGGGGIENPPVCPIGIPTGTPALWNRTTQEWFCGPYNQILTLVHREFPDDFCASGDFLMYYGGSGDIRCINPQLIDPAATATAKREVQERVDVNNDRKWHTIMSGQDVTTITGKRNWNTFKWLPSINYDVTNGSSIVSTPPQALPFDSTLVAATYASFRVNGYEYSIWAPATNDAFTAVVSKLDSTLSETIISDALSFDSVTATSGQVTFRFSGNLDADALAGEAFVGYISSRSWSPPGANRHLVTVTLWIQTSESFTDYWPISG